MTAGVFLKPLRRVLMKQKLAYLAGVVVVFLVLMGVTFAQRPDADIDPDRHPELAKAQHEMVRAYEHIEEAQRANGDELGGHATKAKEFLSLASRELKSAAEYANHHHK
jgi:hypothetical protein